MPPFDRFQYEEPDDEHFCERCQKHKPEECMDPSSEYCSECAEEMRAENEESDLNYE